MFLCGISYYLPEKILKNDFFKDLSGVSDEWIIERTGIKERRRAGADENTHSMGIAAVSSLKESFDLSDVDLIVGATYTPYDTIVTLAHAVQHFIQVPDVPALSITSACSSFINASEIVEGYFAMGKAQKALVITSEHNSAYSNDHEPKSGPLWGDGAAAVLYSKNQLAGGLKVVSIKSAGAATAGKATEAVTLRMHGGLSMPYGKDVFLNACTKMAQVTAEILEENGFSLDDLNYVAPHQANFRITKKVLSNLGVGLDKALSNIQYLGNTGCAGAVIALAEKWEEIKKGEIVVMPVFGGGYSYGAMLLKK